MSRQESISLFVTPTRVFCGTAAWGIGLRPTSFPLRPERRSFSEDFGDLRADQIVVRLTPHEYERLKTMVYHVAPPELAAQMTVLRLQYLDLALQVIRGQAPSRSQSLALTHLEDALMRAIQGLAMQGEPQLPPTYVVEHV